MTTHSQLVDDLIRETRRPDMLRDISDYVNQTIRELHFEPGNNAATFYRENFQESLVVATTATGFSWSIPDPGVFQAMQLVQYMTSGVNPPEVTPSRALKSQTDFYYRVGGTYVFSGYGGQNAMIALGFFAFPSRLVYYPATQRPVEYSPDTLWKYLPQFADSEQLRLAAQAFCSNWILLRWRDLVAEGVRAKIYKRVADTERARTSYSMYTAMRAQMVSSESADLGGFS